MIYTATVTQKGQVTIPVHIRKTLGIKPYEKVSFKKIANMVILTPAVNFLSLKGSIKTKKIFSDDEADRKILEMVKKDYEYTE